MNRFENFENTLISYELVGNHNFCNVWDPGKPTNFICIRFRTSKYPNSLFICGNWWKIMLVWWLCCQTYGNTMISYVLFWKLQELQWFVMNWLEKNHCYKVWDLGEPKNLTFKRFWGSKCPKPLSWRGLSPWGAHKFYVLNILGLRGPLSRNFWK